MNSHITHSAHTNPALGLPGTSHASESEKESWQHIVQLHKLQELVETVNSHNQELLRCNEKLQMRIDCLLRQNPNIWEYESLTVTDKTDQNGKVITISNVYLGNRLVPYVSLALHSSEEKVILELLSASSLRNNLFLSDESAVKGRIDITPTDESPFTGSNLVLSNLSSTDWTTLLSLVKKLSEQLRMGLIEGIEKSELNSLISIEKRLSKWPQVLRFDEIELLDSYKEGAYENISIQLTNISFGNIKRPSFSFRIGTVAAGGMFDKHPRLEFPASSKDSLDTWYAETTDHRGERLELRYSQPGDIDVFVWQQLSNIDRYLITAIIYFLPNQLQEIGLKQKYHEQFKWINVANTIRRIHLNYVKHSGL